MTTRNNGAVCASLHAQIFNETITVLTSFHPKILPNVLVNHFPDPGFGPIPPAVHFGPSEINDVTNRDRLGCFGIRELNPEGFLYRNRKLDTLQPHGFKVWSKAP